MAKKSVKRSKDDVRFDALVDHGEIDSTRAYFDSLKDVYRTQGLLAATGYEIKSSLYSLGKRIGNLFDSVPRPDTGYYTASAGAAVASSRGREYTNDEKHAIIDAQNRIATRKANRVAYILRHKPEEKMNSLERTTATAGVLTLLGSIFFLQSSFTGNVISNLTQSNSNWIGAGLFLIAIVCGIFALKKK